MLENGVIANKNNLCTILFWFTLSSALKKDQVLTLNQLLVWTESSSKHLANFFQGLSQDIEAW